MPRLDHVLFVEDGTLLAQKFDADRLRLVGEPVQVADGVAYFRTLGTGGLSVSSTGVLAVSGERRSVPSSCGMIAAARRSDTGWNVEHFGTLRSRPTAHRVAIDIVDPRSGHCRYLDFTTPRVARQFDSQRISIDASAPVWSADGHRVVFRDARSGAPSLFAKSTRWQAEELLVSMSSPLSAEDWSRDGKWIAFTNATRLTGDDVWLLPLGGERKPRPFSQPGSRNGARDSRPIPHGWRLSRTKPARPRCSSLRSVHPMPRHASRSEADRHHDGEKTARNCSLRPLITAPSCPCRSSCGRRSRRALPTRSSRLPTQVSLLGIAHSPVYDVSPDGNRFLVSVPTGELASSRLRVVLNWPSGLKP